MYRTGEKLSLQVLRNVWAAVTRDRQMPIRALAQTTGYAASTVQSSLAALRDAGYIDFPDGAERARTVIVPFYEEHR